VASGGSPAGLAQGGLAGKADPSAGSGGDPDLEGGAPPVGSGFRPMPNPVSAGLPNPASYDTSAEGIVTDKLTLLSWQRDVDGALLDAATAAGSCQELQLGGYADWRLPTRLELVTLLDFTDRAQPIETQVFPNAPLGSFWTSTAVALQNDTYWQVDFGHGATRALMPDATAKVRCVRGEVYQVVLVAGTDDLADTVKDQLTGLTWQRGDNGVYQTWAGSKTYCENLELAGFSDWRLPSIKELDALVDDSRISPALFPGTVTHIEGEDRFWSSSEYGRPFSRAWTVLFTVGEASDIYYPNQFSGHARCVR
jgi:hypothetical protein